MPEIDSDHVLGLIPWQYTRDSDPTLPRARGLFQSIKQPRLSLMTPTMPPISSPYNALAIFIHAS